MQEALEMKKSLFLVFSICLLFLFLLVGIIIGRHTNTDYVTLTTQADNSINTQDVALENLGKLNINHATSDELQTLNGIGEVLAERIVAYRLENGPFVSVYDLMNVEGIGEKTIREISDCIYVGG